MAQETQIIEWPAAPADVTSSDMEFYLKKAIVRQGGRLELEFNKNDADGQYEVPFDDEDDELINEDSMDTWDSYVQMCCELLEDEGDKNIPYKLFEKTANGYELYPNDKDLDQHSRGYLIVIDQGADALRAADALELNQATRAAIRNAMDEAKHQEAEQNHSVNVSPPAADNTFVNVVDASPLSSRRNTR